MTQRFFFKLKGVTRFEKCLKMQVDCFNFMEHDLCVDSFGFLWLCIKLMWQNYQAGLAFSQLLTAGPRSFTQFRLTFPFWGARPLWWNEACEVGKVRDPETMRGTITLKWCTEIKQKIAGNSNTNNHNATTKPQSPPFFLAAEDIHIFSSTSIWFPGTGVCRICHGQGLLVLCIETWWVVDQNNECCFKGRTWLDNLKNSKVAEINFLGAFTEAFSTFHPRKMRKLPSFDTGVLFVFLNG